MDNFIKTLTDMLGMKNVVWADVWTATVETLSMTFISAIFTFIFGLIIGIILFLTSRSKSKAARVFYSVTAFIVNLFRAIPFIILILLQRKIQ